MSWQDELRRLDLELAQGLLTEQEYRARSEDILAEASFAPATRGPARPAAPRERTPEAPSTRQTPPSRPEAPQSSPEQTPQAQAQARPPQAPPTQAPARPPQASPADPPPPAPRPSAKELLNQPQPTAPSPADAQPTDRLEHPRLGQDPARAAQAPPPVRPEHTLPQAARRELPLPPAEPRRARPRAIPPIDAALPPGGRRTGRDRTNALMIGVGVFSALALLIGVMWSLGTLFHDAPTINETVTSGVPEPEPEALVDRLPALPGHPNDQSSTVSVERGNELNLYERETARAFTEHGVREVTWKGASDPDTVYTVLVATVDEGKSATPVTDALERLVAPVFEPDEPVVPGTSTFRLPGTTTHAFRVLYTSGPSAVRIDVASSSARSAGEVRAELEKLVDQVIRVLPPR